MGLQNLDCLTICCHVYPTELSHGMQNTVGVVDMNQIAKNKGNIESMCQNFVNLMTKMNMEMQQMKLTMQQNQQQIISLLEEVDDLKTRQIENANMQRALSPGNIPMSPISPGLQSPSSVDTSYSTYSARSLSRQAKISKLLKKSASDLYVEEESKMNEQTAERIDVIQWLTNEVKLPQYIDVLLDDGYDSMESIDSISFEDLQIIGVKKHGHKRTIMKYIQLLRNDRFGRSQINAEPISHQYNNVNIWTDVTKLSLQGSNQKTDII